MHEAAKSSNGCPLGCCGLGESIMLALQGIINNLITNRIWPSSPNGALRPGEFDKPGGHFCDSLGVVVIGFTAGRTNASIGQP